MSDPKRDGNPPHIGRDPLEPDAPSENVCPPFEEDDEWSEEIDDGYQVAAGEPPPLPQRRDLPSIEEMELQLTPEPEPEWSIDRKDLQISLKEVMGLTALACVLLGIGRWIPLPVFAGVLGLMALVSLAVASFTEIDSRIVRLVWWTLMAVYLIASIAAVFAAD